MASVHDWIEGARPKTLPAAVAPVMAGSATALVAQGRWTHHLTVIALLAGVIALALQVGVNYANDYSDGIRGTDDVRVGPVRLVGQKLASPGAVKRAAFACFGVAAVAGLVAVVLTGHWWLLAVGVACILAAWFYTGGEHPYGYAGLGEVMVFIFFGLVAVAGTHYLAVGTPTVDAWFAAVAIGAIACALLVTNNARDIDSDRAVGKRTLATRLGDRATRWFFVVLVAVAALCCVVIAVRGGWWALGGLAVLVTGVPAAWRMLRGDTGRALIAVLKLTGQAELLLGVGLLAGAVVTCW